MTGHKCVVKTVCVDGNVVNRKFYYEIFLYTSRLVEPGRRNVIVDRIVYCGDFRPTPARQTFRTDPLRVNLYFKNVQDLRVKFFLIK